MKRIIFLIILYGFIGYFCATPSVIMDVNFEYQKYTDIYKWLTFDRYSLIVQETNRYDNITPDHICALIHHESNGVQYAISYAGARGLMQIMPVHARNNNIGANDLYVEKINISIGTKYFAWCMKRFNNNFRYAIMAYNAGPYANFKTYSNDWYLYGIMKYAKVTESKDARTNLPYY